MADKRKRRKGKLQADKRGFSPSPYALITFQGKEQVEIFFTKIAKEFVERMSEANEVSNFRDL